MGAKLVSMRWGVAISAVVGCLVLAGCGADSEADLTNGKTLFAQKCGACHTLARAGTKGVTGPNLDDAFARSRVDGIPESTFEEVVEQQILLAEGKMPPKLVTGDDARDVGAYVAYAAARPGQDEGALASAGQVGGGKAVKAGADNVIKLSADPGGATAFDAGEATAKAGKVAFVMDNPSSVPHNVAIKDGGVDVKGKVVGKGGVSEASATLKPGKYTFYCSVPGHEEGGMKGTLTVK